MIARHYQKLDSQELGKSKEHLVFGWGGAPVLVFPTSKGRFFQWEDFGMIAALNEHLNNGWLQLFCVDSIDELSWYNFSIHQRSQLEWHLAYERYLVNEFLPLLRRTNSNPFLIAAGASFGGFHAVNFALRHPGVVKRVLGMSGEYETGKYLEGYSDRDSLNNSPLDRLSSLNPQKISERHRQTDFWLTTGRWDFCLQPTLQLAEEMSRLELPHRCYVWDEPGQHDWPMWREQVKAYL